VGELVPPHGLLIIDHQPGHDGRLDRLQGRLVVQPGHRPDQIQVEPAPGDGGDQQDRIGLLRQSRQPPPQHVPDPDRDLSPHGGERVIGLEVASAVEQPDQLGDEERVAFGALVHRTHQAVCRPAPEGGGDEAGDLGFTEALEGDPLNQRLAGQRSEYLGQRLADLCLHVAVGPDNGQPSVPDLAGQERQQPQRSSVGPVQIIDHHQQRPSVCQPAQHLGDGLIEPEADRRQLHHRRRLQPRDPLLQLWQQLTEVAARPPQHADEFPRWNIGE
jgi:hypothetical protein